METKTLTEYIVRNASGIACGNVTAESPETAVATCKAERAAQDRHEFDALREPLTDAQWSEFVNAPTSATAVTDEDRARWAAEE